MENAIFQAEEDEGFPPRDSRSSDPIKRISKTSNISKGSHISSIVESIKTGRRLGQF